MKPVETNAVRKPLTHFRQAEAAKPEPKPYKLNAGEGLFIEVNRCGVIPPWRKPPASP
jgi:hypothetical protein